MNRGTQLAGEAVSPFSRASPLRQVGPWRFVADSAPPSVGALLYSNDGKDAAVCHGPTPTSHSDRISAIADVLSKTALPSRFHSRWPSLELWERTRYFIPRCFGSHENMFARTHARFTVDASQDDLRYLPTVGANKRGTALPAEAPLSIGGGMIPRDEFNARGPPELVRVDKRPRRKCRPVRLPAHGTMAVTSGSE